MLQIFTHRSLFFKNMVLLIKAFINFVGVNIYLIHKTLCKKMANVLSLEQLRLLFVSIVSTLISFYTPTGGFMLALIIMFAFNVWCGMRADGVSINRCKNFSMSKFHKALMELFIYVCIILVVFTCMKAVGDEKSSLVAIKSITYVFMYVYTQNGFKNLIQAYPDNMAIHIIYHVIRLEFTRALPSRVNDIIERYEREHENKKNNADNKEL